jgi:eukaryotic-like serine/threonine-protein kinase
METIAVPLNRHQGLEIDGKYPLGTCLAERERQSVYETTFKDEPAIIKIFVPETSRAAAELIASLEAARNLQHENLLQIYDFGRATAGDERLVYAVMERAEDNLAAVLAKRLLDEDEMSELLAGIIPALQYLHGKGFAHSHIRPANVLACGDKVKLSSDRLRSINLPRLIAEPRGLRDAPETGAGRFTPASDIWSLSILTLESLTGSPLESSLERVRPPFHAIVEGGLSRDPKQRWSLEAIHNLLQPKVRPGPVAAPKFGVTDDQPRYRKLRGIAVAGVLVAASICVLLIRSAHQNATPPPPAAPVVAESSATDQYLLPPSVPEPPKPAPVENQATIPHQNWAVVGAAYRRQADAEKRARDIHKAHPSLNPTVYPSEPDSPRYLVVFGTGMNETQASRALATARRSGAPGDTYRTQLR